MKLQIAEVPLPPSTEIMENLPTFCPINDFNLISDPVASVVDNLAINSPLVEPLTTFLPRIEAKSAIKESKIEYISKGIQKSVSHRQWQTLLVVEELNN